MKEKFEDPIDKKTMLGGVSGMIMTRCNIPFKKTARSYTGDNDESLKMMMLTK